MNATAQKFTEPLPMRYISPYLPWSWLAYLLVLLSLPALAASGPLQNDLTHLSDQWTYGSYQLPPDQRDDFFASLQPKAHQLVMAYPGHAEPLIWEGIITATHAKYQNPFSALSSARQARDLLLQAISLDPKAMDGSALITLGALYFRVPKLGSFGDTDKAKQYLNQALTLDPDNIDANYFYGKFLLEQGDHQAALSYLKKAAALPPRPQSLTADRFRHDEVVQLLNGGETPE
ncbi:MAG: tetratricopeptide repeat protein [Ferrovum myxofaciens]|uniref:tetratricopeptide repeat protein n=1 Tax=Ferrovum myxofaciens TaxID=416213 RepID=UPI001C773176|nr:tetratricopeptide repeat protein [Ferrovum myxofaciens]QWY75463.1 MAG: tetratricopeptide repeat protein [Ferrovum myxofaciens]